MRIVEAQGIRKTFRAGSRPVEALRGVGLAVDAGEFVGVTGRSAAGKSTLLQILGCLDRPTRGTYRLAGRNVSRLADVELARIRAARIGFVFQNFNLIPEFTVLENVMLPFQYQAADRGTADATRRAKTAIDRVGLTRRAMHRPAELSGGEMQRAAIARAIAVEPLLILADEPTGNLDSTTSEEILDLFREFHDEGATLIVVTHSETVASRCQRIVRLRDGRIDTDESPS